jgi:hypothetical protein
MKTQAKAPNISAGQHSDDPKIEKRIATEVRIRLRRLMHHPAFKYSLWPGKLCIKYLFGKQAFNGDPAVKQALVVRIFYEAREISAVGFQAYRPNISA